MSHVAIYPQQWPEVRCWTLNRWCNQYSCHFHFLFRNSLKIQPTKYHDVWMHQYYTDRHSWTDDVKNSIYASNKSLALAETFSSILLVHIALSRLPRKLLSSGKWTLCLIRVIIWNYLPRWRQGSLYDVDKNGTRNNVYPKLSLTWLRAA